MPFLGFWNTRKPEERARWTISEKEAFDHLIALALQMEKFPDDILKKGRADGWYERLRMLGENMGWKVEIKITDIEGQKF